MGKTPRLRLPYAELTDSADIFAEVRPLAFAIDGVAKDDHGTLGARPAPSLRGKYYYATDTKVLYRDTGTAWVAVCVPGGGPTLLTPGTFPPASPVDGQEVHLLITTTFSEVMWHLRYNAASASAFKWERVGGPFLINESDSVASYTGTGAYVDFAGPGNVDAVDITTPRAGEYEILFGATFYAAFTAVSRIAPKIGTAATADADSVITDLAASPNVALQYSAHRKLEKTLATSDLIKLQIKTTNTLNAEHQKRYLMLRPKRIS